MIKKMSLILLCVTQVGFAGNPPNDFKVIAVKISDAGNNVSNLNREDDYERLITKPIGPLSVQGNQLTEHGPCDECIEDCCLPITTLGFGILVAIWNGMLPHQNVD